MDGAVQFPVLWSPERLAALSRWQQDFRTNPTPFDVVKMHWRESRFTVTYRDGSKWVNVTDLERFTEEEHND